jgi:RIO kinase 2
MKLDVQLLRYLTRDDFRVLTALEQGMKNHDVVPTELISAISGLRSGVVKVLGNLLHHKLIFHDASLYDGYRLTYPGYDFLALRTLLQRGVLAAVGRQIGVGKESDVYLGASADGAVYALKLQRLGRVSFRAVKRTRDYMQGRKSVGWLYMSRLATLKEFAFMQVGAGAARFVLLLYPRARKLAPPFPLPAPLSSLAPP